ncbi:MAG: prepilin-type N-terminal cleavage/methylation domain-containing protein [Candidatus Gracilibacteria bacterium]
MQYRKYAFTLVELIVVITILAILGTIAFISLQGYSKTARDSTRISDLSTMKTSLELFNLDSGKYPEPTYGFDVIYSGSEVWTQGIFGIDTTNNVERLDKIPKDPLTDKEYTYSVTKTRQEYQLAGLMEGDEIVLNGLNTQTNAGDTIATAIVIGNYNGQTLKTETGTTCEILSVPSIISSEGDITTDLKTILDNQDLVYSGYNNLPSNYIDSKYKTDEGFLFTSEKLVVYSDNKECGLLYEEDPTARINLIKNLQTAYSGTILENNDNIRRLVALDITDINSITLLSTVLVNNNLGGEITSYETDALICEEGEHTEDGINCIANTGVCTITNGTGTDTWNGIDWDCTLNTCNIDFYNNVDDTCSIVGVGYYSNATDTTRTACTNKIANSTYTSDGGGNNNCSYSCDSGYELNGGVCEALPYSSCTTKGQIKTATTKYGSCTTYDIIVCSGVGSGYAVAACNIGTNTAGTTSTSYGKYFQWGNNFGSNIGGSITTTRVNASGYGPGNYYTSSPNFIKGYSDWTNPQYSNLWGDDVDTSIARQGPCESGYHIPKKDEWTGIIADGGWGTNGSSMSTALKLPIAGLRNRSTALGTNVGVLGYYRASTPYSTQGNDLKIGIDSISATSSYARGHGHSIRCFRN